MKKHSMWRKNFVALLFITILFVNIQPSPSIPNTQTSDVQIPIRQKGIRSPFKQPNSAGPSSQLFSGSFLMMLANSTARQLLSIVMQSTDGSLVVVDGGWPIDSHHLTQVIQRNGGHVSAWFITHPHSDHVGALIEILNNPNSPITIDRIYYSLADQSWYDAVESSRSETVRDLREALAKHPAEKLHGDIYKGQEIQVGDIHVTVMNNPYLLGTAPVNNSSVAYKFLLDDTSILILGDLGPEGGQRLLSDLTPQELKSDVVQMSHHGQYGVGREVYAAIDPKVCLWPTPLWLWNNDSGGGIDSGNWLTLETHKWMEDLNVTTHYSIKDGDWMIR